MNAKIILATIFTISAMPVLAQTEPVPMPHTLSWKDVSQQALPAAGEKIAYGSLPQQFGELRVPEGKGPFPVLVLVHGGCWLSDFDYVHNTPLAAAITAQGIAVWTVEYRRLGDAGGGWPGTFLDVAKAADHLRVLARKYPLDLRHVAVAGHSAGGQLALWLAARHKLPHDSELYLNDPLKISGVVGLAAITDLATYRVGAPDSCNASVDQLLGGTPQMQAHRYAETSPLGLLPLGVPQWLVQGDHDPIVPPDSARAYVDAANRVGDHAQLIKLPGAGHFEPVVPQGVVWPQVFTAIRAALGKDR